MGLRKIQFGGDMGFCLSINVDIQQTYFKKNRNDIELLKKLNSFPNRILSSQPDSDSNLVIGSPFRVLKFGHSSQLGVDQSELK